MILIPFEAECEKMEKLFSPFDYFYVGYPSLD